MLFAMVSYYLNDDNNYDSISEPPTNGVDEEEGSGGIDDEEEDEREGKVKNDQQHCNDEGRNGKRNTLTNDILWTRFLCGLYHVGGHLY